MAQDDVFNLGNSEEASAFLKEKKANDDGLLRPKLEEGKDGIRSLVIRFLPNLQKTGKLGTTAIEKHIHYANFKNNPELQGYFDCLKNTNIGKECPLCKTYWALFNSNNPADKDKAKLINRSTKYYAYVYVVEDKQVPANEGKIFIFPFGYKIFQKIKMKAESTRKPVKVEDLIHGANLNLVIQEVGGFYNYDASEFESPEPIEFNGKQLKVAEDGTISDKERARVVDFLMSREHELESFIAQDWTPEQYEKADKIIALLSGVAYDGSSHGSTTTKTAPLSSASVFEDDDEDEDDDVPSTPAPTKAKAKIVEDEDEDEDEVKPSKTVKSTTSTVNDARKKANAFFDEDED